MFSRPEETSRDESRVRRLVQNDHNVFPHRRGNNSWGVGTARTHDTPRHVTCGTGCSLACGYVLCGIFRAVYVSVVDASMSLPEDDVDGEMCWGEYAVGW